MTGSSQRILRRIIEVVGLVQRNEIQLEARVVARETDR